MGRSDPPAATQAVQRDRVTFAFGLVVLGVATALAVGEVFKPQTLPGFDLGAYLGAARRVLAGAPLYDLPAAGLVLGPYGQFVYPPPVAIAFIPLALAPVGLAIGIWLALLGAIAIAFGLALGHSLVPAQRPWILALVISFQPLLWDVRLGNTALLTAGLCWLAWASRDRPRRAGAIFAAGLGVKLLPLLLVPYLVAAGRFRMLGWTAFAGLVVVAVTLPLVGPAAWSDYWSLLGSIVTAPPARGPNVLPPVFGDGGGRIALIAAAIAIAVGAGLAARRPRLETRTFAVALATAPLLSTTVWYPYLALAVPALVLVGLGDGAADGRGQRIGPAGAIGRVVIWGALGAQLIRQDGRDFILPFFGLFALLGWAVSDLVRATRPGVLGGGPATPAGPADR